MIATYCTFAMTTNTDISSNATLQRKRSRNTQLIEEMQKLPSELNLTAKVEVESVCSTIFTSRPNFDYHFLS
jgi:hypothetical protein